jgi:hypothetical protein
MATTRITTKAEIARRQFSRNQDMWISPYPSWRRIWATGRT